MIRGDPYGYTDIKVNVLGPNNRVYEVQISTPALQLAKEGDGHAVYERGRKIEGQAAEALRKVVERRLGLSASVDQIDAAFDRAFDLFKKFDPKMQKIYADSRKVYLPAFEEFFRSSSAAARASSSANASLEISSPSAQIEEGGTAANIPSGMALSAMGPAMTAGIPSTSKYRLSTTSLTSEPSVAEQVSQSNIVEPPGTRTISVPGSNIRFRAAPRVVELESLITSDLPAYDQRFQPRNRDQRVALKEQSRNIAANLDPNQLMPGRTTGDGSPIVGPTGMVESGNGRVMALRIAAQQFPENYQAYRDFLAAEGYDVAGLEAPVLILDRLTPMSDNEIIAYTAGANRRVQAAMSSTELAKADARLIDEGILTQLNSGDMSQAQNIQAISQFFAKLPTAELNDLVDKTGKPNEAGQQRAEAAMVAKALGNAEGIDSLLERLYETQDEGVRTLTNAIRLAAFRLADLRLGIETGRVPAEYDIAQDLVNAYNQVREGRRKNLDGREIISQQDLTASPNQTALLKLFYKPDGKLHTQDTIGSELIYYATQASQQRLDQSGLFDEVVLVPPDSILESAGTLIADPKPSAPARQRAASRAFTERAGPTPKAMMEPRTRESQAKFPHRRGAMQSWGVKLIVDEVMDSWSLESAPRVLVVQDSGELPTHVLAELGPDINGATDLNNGTIYLVANNIADPSDTKRVFLHEAVGHYGFSQLYGDRFPKMVDDILRLEERDGTVRRIARGIRARYIDSQGNFNLDRPTFAAEVVAHLAENQPKHPFAKRVIAQFREILRALGFKINLSRNDLTYLLRRSADAMAERNMGVRTARSINPIQASRAELQSPRTDPYGRPLNEFGQPIDQEGRIIPEGQEELFTEPPPPAETPPLELERPQGQVGAGPSRAPQITGQRGLFASRPAQGELLGNRPTAINRPLEVGGGTYNLNQFGRLSQAELNVLDSVIGELDAPVEAQRRGTQPWTATERAALDMIQNQYGVTIDSLVNRRPGSAANAEQLEAYGILIANTSQRIKALADSIGRNPSSEQLAELADLKERLGMLLAPALGYQTEAGRSLNILRKMSGELKNADDIMAALGDGSENALKDFVVRVQEADSLDQVIGVTRAAYTPTWWDKFYEYWINGILSGPTTHTVNMVSNALFSGLELTAEALASVASKDVSSRAVAARVAAIPHGVMMGLKNGKTAFVEERAILTPEDKLEESRKAIGGTLGKVIRIPGRALQAEDEFFKAIAYQGELAALAMEEAIKTNPADVQAEFSRIMGQVAARPDLIKAAKRKAAQVTFTTPMGPNVAAIARVLSKTKVGRLIVPFIRTPTNILLEATRYTPAAFALEQVRKDLSNGGRDAALGWSRMAVGSSVMMGIAALAAQGILSGAGPDDPNQRAQLMRQGWRPYSVKLPNGSWVRYNRFEPFGMLMGVSADLTEIGMTMKEGDYSKVASMLMTSVATNLGDKTFLSGLTDFAQAYSDPQRYLESWANRMAASPVPNIIGQTARWLDPYQREANTIIDQYKARIPGLSQQLAERLDIAGEPITRDSSVPGNPFQVSEPKEDALARAMLELGVRKGSPGRSLTIEGRQYKLEGENYRGYKEFIQKSRYNVLTPIVRSPQFQAMQQQNPQMAAYYLEKYWEDIGRDAKLAWLYRNAGSLGQPVSAPAGLDLAGTYNLGP